MRRHHGNVLSHTNNFFRFIELEDNIVFRGRYAKVFNAIIVRDNGVIIGDAIFHVFIDIIMLDAGIVAKVKCRTFTNAIK